MKMLNDPSKGVDENFITVQNTTADALEDGDVVIYDFSSDADALIQGVASVASAISGKVAGVVTIPVAGQTCPVGEFCKVMTKGIHKAVKKTNDAITRGDQVATSATALKAYTAASDAPAGAQLGYAAATAAEGTDTFICRVDVK